MNKNAYIDIGAILGIMIPNENTVSRGHSCDSIFWPHIYPKNSIGILDKDRMSWKEVKRYISI
jgi:hypothetical protein